MYGEVLEISVKNTQKLRGQAFIVFRDSEQASRALAKLQGSSFFSKPMVKLLA